MQQARSRDTTDIGRDVLFDLLGQILKQDNVADRKLAARLAQLQPGTWLWVEHCATDTPEIQAMGKNVAFDRSGVVAAWSDAKVLAAVKKYGIKLTSYKELIARQ